MSLNSNHWASKLHESYELLYSIQWMIFQALVNSHNEDLVSETSPRTNGRSILFGIVKNFSANIKINISWECWNCYTISKFENKKNSKKSTISSSIFLDTSKICSNIFILPFVQGARYAWYDNSFFRIKFMVWLINTMCCCNNSPFINDWSGTKMPPISSTVINVFIQTLGSIHCAGVSLGC